MLTYHFRLLEKPISIIKMKFYFYYIVKKGIQMSYKIFLALIICFMLSHCTTVTHSISTPTIYLKDLDITDEVWGQAKSVKIFGIDFGRVSKRKVEGATIGKSADGMNIITQTPSLSFYNTEPLALQNLLKKNSEYDVIISPKFSKTVDGFWPIYYTETVMVKARVGKIK